MLVISLHSFCQCFVNIWQYLSIFINIRYCVPTCRTVLRTYLPSDCLLTACLLFAYWETWQELIRNQKYLLTNQHSCNHLGAIDPRWWPERQSIYNSKYGTCSFVYPMCNRDVGNTSASCMFTGRFALHSYPRFISQHTFSTSTTWQELIQNQ